MPKRRLDSPPDRAGAVSLPQPGRGLGDGRRGPAGRRRAAGAKPGELVDAAELLTVQRAADYVSRGGIKLANALAGTGVRVDGRRASTWEPRREASPTACSSTAREVIAVDVGYGLLDYRLRIDPRVLVMERTNARALTPELLPASPSGAAGRRISRRSTCRSSR